MIELLKTAQKAGHTADYVLFDTWFSNPAQLTAIKNLGLDCIAMIKKSSRLYYESCILGNMTMKTLSCFLKNLENTEQIAILHLIYFIVMFYNNCINMTR